MGLSDFWQPTTLWLQYAIQYISITELEFHFIYNPQYSCAEHMPICDMFM